MLKKGEEEGGVGCRWSGVWKRRVWPEKHHEEVEEAAGATWASALSETGVPRWQAITQALRQGFQQTPVLPGPSPHASLPDTLTHSLEPYTPTFVSTVIRLIADYIYNCLTQSLPDVHQSTASFSNIYADWSERRLFSILTSYFSNAPLSLVEMEEFFGQNVLLWQVLV